MKGLIDTLRKNRHLPEKDYISLVRSFDEQSLEYIMTQAAEVSAENFRKKVYIRGLVEFSNFCRHGCIYCGLRKQNHNVRRYRMTPEEIYKACGRAHEAGFRTFVLQSGEDPAYTDDIIETIVRTLHSMFPDTAITLSTGERSEKAYMRFREAGADRYLLRFETSDRVHYGKLHTSGEDFDKRMECLEALHRCGYQTGTGMMTGSPYQSPENIVKDILFIEKFRPEMIGIGPFIPHKDSPFSEFPHGSAEMTLLLISIFRLMFPEALIPSTTALNTLSPENRLKGILAGANVLMPDITPETYRKDYEIYDGKACTGAEAAEGIADLEKELGTIGYSIDCGRGDYPERKPNP